MEIDLLFLVLILALEVFVLMPFFLWFGGRMMGVNGGELDMGQCVWVNVVAMFMTALLGSGLQWMVMYFGLLESWGLLDFEAWRKFLMGGLYVLMCLFLIRRRMDAGFGSALVMVVVAVAGLIGLWYVEGLLGYGGVASFEYEMLGE